jgi:hypothetical protein
MSKKLDLLARNMQQRIAEVCELLKGVPPRSGGG